jgi:hypothetical protein
MLFFHFPFTSSKKLDTHSIIRSLWPWIHPRYSSKSLDCSFVKVIKQIQYKLVNIIYIKCLNFVSWWQRHILLIQYSVPRPLYLSQHNTQPMPPLGAADPFRDEDQNRYRPWHVLTFAILLLVTLDHGHQVHFQFLVESLLGIRFISKWHLYSAYAWADCTRYH